MWTITRCSLCNRLIQSRCLSIVLFQREKAERGFFAPEKRKSIRKPFITRSWDKQEDEKLRHPWYSGELFGYYHDWLFHTCREEAFDCNSGGVPHKHCMDTLIAQKTAPED